MIRVNYSDRQRTCSRPSLSSSLRRSVSPRPRVPTSTTFGTLRATDFGLLPSQVDTGLAGANNIKAILQSSWSIADEVNKLRGLEGTGHGRTLPTGVTAEMALMVVREACNVAEFALTTLDRVTGRRI